MNAAALSMECPLQWVNRVAISSLNVWSFDVGHGQVSLCLLGSSQMSPLRSLLEMPFEISALTLYIRSSVHQAFTSQFANLHCYDHATRDTTHNNIDDP